MTTELPIALVKDGVSAPSGPKIIEEISQAAYDALSPPDSNTLYLITS